MLTKEANGLIGKRALVINERLDIYNKIVTLDQIILHGYGPMGVRVIPPGESFVWLYENDLKFCTCGESDECSICAEGVTNELLKERGIRRTMSDWRDE